MYIQVSQKWRTNGALRCRRDYRKRQKNVKKILLTYFLIWRSLNVALNRSIILKYMYEIFRQLRLIVHIITKYKITHYQYLILHNREF
jgi:glyoxylate carboligase